MTDEQIAKFITILFAVLDGDDLEGLADSYRNVLTLVRSLSHVT